MTRMQLMYYKKRFAQFGTIYTVKKRDQQP